MSVLEESLKRIDTWIEQNNSILARKLRSNLRPGLVMQDIEEKLSNLFMIAEVAGSEAMRLSKEVYELYQWHNGEAEVAEMVHFLSLETSIALRTQYDPAGFFAVFSSDYYYCGITGSKYQEDSSPVLFDCFENGPSYSKS